MDEVERQRQIVKSLRDILANLNSERSPGEVLDFIAAQDNRLACELYDSVIQILFSAALIADILPELWELDQKMGREHLDELRRLSRRALAEMRVLLLELRPATLTETGLDDLLAQLAEAILGREGLPVTIKIEGQDPLPDRVQVGLYHIAQEALNNISKHARAGRVEVTLRRNETQVELTINDNGCGFNPTRVPAGRRGLDIMRERAAAIGATLNIDSRPDQGVRTTVVWRRTAKTTTTG